MTLIRQAIDRLNISISVLLFRMCSVLCFFRTVPDEEDAILCIITNFAAVANNVRLSAHDGQWQLFNRGRSVLHQFKVANLVGSDPFVRSHVTLSVGSNIWCKSDHHPLTIEYLVEYAKEDCFIGIVADEFEPDASFEHHIGGDRHSLSLSVRTGWAWHDGQEVSNVKRIEYLPTKRSLQQTQESVDQIGSPSSDSIGSPASGICCFCLLSLSPLSFVESLHIVVRPFINGSSSMYAECPSAYANRFGFEDIVVYDQRPSTGSAIFRFSNHCSQSSVYTLSLYGSGVHYVGHL